MRAVNLIPAEHRSGGGGAAGRSGGAAYVVIALIAALAALAVLYGSARNEVSSKEGEASRLSAEAQRAEAQASRLAPYTHFEQVREERVKAVDELVNTRFDWAHVMHELGRVLPTSVSLSSVDGTVGPSAATVAPATSSSSTASSTASGSVSSATPPGSTPSFTMTGCTKTQSDVALAMNRLRLMDGVSEVSLQTSTKAGSAGAGNASAGSCPDSFTLQVSYEGLPQPSASRSGSAEPASGGTGSSASRKDTSTSAGLR